MKKTMAVLALVAAASTSGTLPAATATAAPLATLNIEKISKAVLLFLCMELIALMLLTYIPELTLVLPRLLGYIY